MGDLRSTVPYAVRVQWARDRRRRRTLRRLLRLAGVMLAFVLFVLLLGLGEGLVGGSAPGTPGGPRSIEAVSING